MGGEGIRRGIPVLFPQHLGLLTRSLHLQQADNSWPSFALQFIKYNSGRAPAAGGAAGKVWKEVIGPDIWGAGS